MTLTLLKFLSQLIPIALLGIIIFNSTQHAYNNMHDILKHTRNPILYTFIILQTTLMLAATISYDLQQ